jgi:hypothetical protein
MLAKDDIPRSPSSQASNLSAPMLGDDESQDHMGAIARAQQAAAEEDPTDEEEPGEGSVFIPKRAAKSKATSKGKAKVIRPAFSEEESEYEELTEIPYMVKILNVLFPDTCSPTN